jgi:hypothetical protein
VKVTVAPAPSHDTDSTPSWRCVNVTIQDTRRSGGTSTQRPPPAAGFFMTYGISAWFSAYAEPFDIRP